MFKESRKLFFWIAGLGLLTYIWTIFFGFTYFDDKVLILDNLSFLRNLGNIPRAFTIDVFRILSDKAAYYRPLLTLSFMLDAQISGSNPFFYHLTNVVIHVVTSCAVFVFLHKIKIRKEIAFLFSVIFAVHPVLSQAVAWIPGRNDSLLALFSLLSFIFFINYVESGRPRDIIWHIVFLAAAIFTKENALLVSPMIVLYYLLFERKQIMSKKSLISLAWVGTIGVWYLLRVNALQNPMQYTLAEGAKSILLGLPAVVIDLGKVFFPVNLSVLPTIQDSTLVWGILVIFLLVVFIIISKRRNNKMVLFGAAWFLVFLLPTFIRPDNQFITDFLEHRIYLPIIGLFMVLSEVDFVKNFSFSSGINLTVIRILISVLVVVSIIHTSVFKDKTHFWKSAVSSTPHYPLVHKNLGVMYYLDGDLDKAEIENKKTLELNPKENMVHNNLGLVYAARGDWVKAQEEYKKELEIDPMEVTTLFNYGNLLYKEGKISEAEKMWLDALIGYPDNTDIMTNLFLLYYENKNYAKANYYFNELKNRGINLRLK